MVTHPIVHNWLLQDFSKDYDLASHTTPVVRVSVIQEQRGLQI